MPDAPRRTARLSTVAFVICAGALVHAEPSRESAAPHLREYKNRPFRHKNIETLKVDFNRGEIKGDVTWHTHAVRVFDRTVTSAFAPDWFTYAPSLRSIARSKKIIAPLVVDITKYKASSYAAAASPPSFQWMPFGKVVVDGLACTLYAKKPGEAAPKYFYILYGDPAAKETKPFIYYSIHVVSHRGRTDEISGWIDEFLEPLRIRPRGWRPHAKGAACLDFSPASSR
jgi:hypothetical protein